MIISPLIDMLMENHVFQRDTNDCGPCALTTAIRGLLGIPIELDDVREILHGRLPSGATPPWALVQGLRSFGVTARWSALRSRAYLRRRLLDVDAPVLIVLIGQWRPLWAHWKIVAAWDEKKELWGFVDPAAVEPLVWQRDREFLSEWRAFGRQLVEVFRG